MYNSQIIVERIKRIAKEKNISMAFLNEKSELSENTISASAKSTYGMKAKNLYMIADCLGVSVDYLLGRTDNPQSITGNSIKTGDITGDNNANINSEKSTDNITKKFIEIFDNLPLKEQLAVMNFAIEQSEKT